jgi:hypothetical protein
MAAVRAGSARRSRQVALRKTLGMARRWVAAGIVAGAALNVAAGLVASGRALKGRPIEALRTEYASGFLLSVSSFGATPIFIGDRQESALQREQAVAYRFTTWLSITAEPSSRREPSGDWP